MVFAWLFLVACVHLRVDAQDLRLYGLRLSSTQEYPSEKDYNAVAEKAEEVFFNLFHINLFLSVSVYNWSLISFNSRILRVFRNTKTFYKVNIKFSAQWVSTTDIWQSLWGSTDWGKVKRAPVRAYPRKCSCRCFLLWFFTNFIIHTKKSKQWGGRWQGIFPRYIYLSIFFQYFFRISRYGWILFRCFFTPYLF